MDILDRLKGKIANQFPKVSMGGTRCGKCSTVIDKPLGSIIKLGDYINSSINAHKYHYYLYTYDLYASEQIYETGSGFAICYCSEYCAKKHNHRFK